MKKKLIKILLPLTLLFACLEFVACNRLPEKLSAPENLRVEGGILYWDKVEYADGYLVYLDGKNYQTAECRYDVSGLNEAEVHTLEVMACSNKGIADSARSQITFSGKYAESTQGFGFEKIGQTDRYKVVKFAVDETGTCAIPSRYQGKEVVLLAPSVNDPALLQIKNLILPNSIDYVNIKGSASASMTVIVELPFMHFKNLETIGLKKGDENENYVSEGNCIIEKSTRKLMVGGLKSIIPNDVTKIATQAFAGRNLKKITIPNSVTQIEFGAFYKCDLLTEIVLPSNLEQISSQTFSGCSSLKNISLPTSITKIRIGAFEKCSSLESVLIPNSVKSIDQNAFFECTSLKSVVLPANLASISNGAFRKCTSLTEITIPESVTTIFGDAFSDCTALTEVVVKGSVESIEARSFYNCVALKSIVLPKSIKRINSQAFFNCTSLTEVYYAGTEAEWTENVTQIEKGNDTLLSATRCYYSETAPTEAGNYWRYVNGVPTQWESVDASS